MHFCSCSFVSVALFFPPPQTQKNKYTKAALERKWSGVKHHKATHKGNTLSDVNPPGTVHDGETATVEKDKKDQDPGGAQCSRYI